MSKTARIIKLNRLPVLNLWLKYRAGAVEIEQLNIDINSLM